ncbi:hypothetical protein HDV05_001518, partial [Chytridiales sp. JEL 0842]
MSADLNETLAIISRACIELEAPATRVAANETIERFARTPNILPVCRYILDHTREPLVQFHIANIMKNAALSEYNFHSKESIQSLREYIIHYTLQQRPSNLNAWNNIPIINKLAQFIAVLVKRGWLDATVSEKEAFINQLIEMKKAESFTKHVALAILSQLMIEFSSEASAMGLPWDFHHACHKSFEENELGRLFQITLDSLLAYVHTPTLLEGEGELKFALGSLNLASRILS